MKSLAFSLSLAFGLALSACQTAEMRAPQQTHMLRLQCADDIGSARHSRFAVLDLGDLQYDFGLATGHAVPLDRPCEARDFEGRRADVRNIVFAPNYVSGQSTDWAVVKFDKIETPGLVRYRLVPFGDGQDWDGAEVSFAKARGLPGNFQTCRLSVLDFRGGHRRIAHDCRAVPGQSGSPVTRVSNGENQLVGLHIGHLWMIESPITGRPDRKGYINLLDAQTIEAIEDAIAEMG